MQCAGFGGRPMVQGFGFGVQGWGLRFSVSGALEFSDAVPPCLLWLRLLGVNSAESRSLC